MSLKYIKTRTSSGRRTSVLIDYKKILTTDKPEKSLTVTVAKSSGRNNSGKITVRHHGGAQKRKLRIID
jgi:large subunit ribosomal protein L2